MNLEITLVKDKLILELIKKLANSAIEKGLLFPKDAHFFDNLVAEQSLYYAKNKNFICSFAISEIAENLYYLHSLVWTDPELAFYAINEKITEYPIIFAEVYKSNLVCIDYITKKTSFKQTKEFTSSNMFSDNNKVTFFLENVCT